MNAAATEAALNREVDTFNARYPVGTPVRFWPGLRTDGPRFSTTRTEAQILSDHTAVVWVDGYAACIALTHVEAIEGATA
ncbi:hypothetical protein [Actinoplanes rectilineatus]|uniref:hypothetical protein n=1 Tax=Actinoplanes rectilineatus TaxID=113571 RepID=UPI0005F293A0|nr:hypothetical protein [Actinoplanes rectilineatus]